MSCNGCIALGLNCAHTCVLRPGLQWINSAQEQRNAAVFLANFYGPGRFIDHVAAVPDEQKAVVVRSLLLEACGCVLFPTGGVAGLLERHKYDECKAAVATVLAGGTLTPIPYIPFEQPVLTLSVGPIATNPSSGSSSGNDEKETLDLFK